MAEKKKKPDKDYQIMKLEAIIRQIKEGLRQLLRMADE